MSAKTVWIVDTNDSPATLQPGFVPLINGSDTNFSHPFVLTYPPNGYPTDKPRPQLVGPEPDRFSHGWPASACTTTSSGAPSSASSARSHELSTLSYTVAPAPSGVGATVMSGASPQEPLPPDGDTTDYTHSITER